MPKQEVERKSEWFCGVKFFALKKFAFSLVVFYSHVAISFWFYLVFRSFLNGFPNPFIMYSRTRFLFQQNFHFPLVVFFHMRHFDIGFLFFFFWFNFLEMGNSFPNSLIVLSRSGFLFSQWKFFELYIRTCPDMFFYNSKNLNRIGSRRVVSGILPAMFFLRSVHKISWFLKSNWSSDFGHAETGSGAKKRVVLRREIFSI